MSAQPSTPHLRPLGIGEILDVGIKIYTRNWLNLWKVVVFVVLPAQILVNVIEASATPKSLNSAGAPSFSSQPVVISHHDAVILITGIGAAFLVQFVGAQLAQGACLRLVAEAYLGDVVSWRSSLRYALRRLPSLIGLTLLTALLVGLGAIFCVIPGIYLWGAFFVAVPVLLVEGSGPIRSLGRSRRLVSGRWWGTFGVAVVGYLLVAIVSFALTALFVGVAFASPARNSATGFVLNTLASTVASMLTTPAAAAFATVLYIDLRVRKEGFDLLLLARGLGSEGGAPPVAPAFLPPAPVPASHRPPYWPPPPGWTPPEPGSAPPAAPGASYQQPPYWPPPPGWTPGPPPEPPAGSEPSSHWPSGRD